MHKSYINEALLKKHGACVHQRSLFVTTFGKGDVPVTLENIDKAYNAGLNFSWLMHRLDDDWSEKAWLRYTRQDKLSYVHFINEDAKKSLIRLLKRTGRL